MGLFNKSKNNETPKVPSLPDFPGENKSMDLPSLPKNFNESMNRDIIKSAMTELPEPFEESEKDKHLEDNFSNGGFIPSIPSSESSDIGGAHRKFMPSETDLPSIRREIKVLEGPDSIFIKLDKFRLAKKEISDVKRSLSEAEELIKKVNEIKLKEDEEIKDINLSLDDVKKKLGDIDSLVFDKI